MLENERAVNRELRLQTRRERVHQEGSEQLELRLQTRVKNSDKEGSEQRQRQHGQA